MIPTLTSFRILAFFSFDEEQKVLICFLLSLSLSLSLVGLLSYPFAIILRSLGRMLARTVCSNRDERLIFFLVFALFLLVFVWSQL